MDIRVAITCLLVCALHDVTGSDVPVFITDLLISTYGRLGSRQCLPDDFNNSHIVGPASACAAEVSGGGLPPECSGAPILPLFYNCYTSTLGLLNADATSFSLQGVKERLDSNSGDEVWVNNAKRMLNDCKKNAAPELTARQEAVYYFMCFKWSQFSDCDEKQENNGTLDGEGKLRRVRFFCGDCPLSPSTLQDILERIANKTLEECSVEPCMDQPYESQISRLLCLLDDFIDSCSGNLDVKMLKKAIRVERQGCGTGPAGQLLAMVKDCDHHDDPQDFVKCWANQGVMACVYHEANEAAKVFPNTCIISVD